VQNIAARVANTAEAGERIRNGVGGIAAAAEHMAESSTELSNLSNNLKDMLEFFKLGEEEREFGGGMEALSAKTGRSH
jgi:methyl-accepting chemotaxis protein